MNKIVKRMLAGVLIATTAFGLGPATKEPHQEQQRSTDMQECMYSQEAADIVARSKPNYEHPENVTPEFVCGLLKQHMPDYYNDLFGPKVLVAV